ncbi:hypothetical protein KIN20_002768, partial [Parelaphostrongylus tenuis]
THEQGQRSRKSSQQGTTFPCHTHAITEDYVASHEVHNPVFSYNCRFRKVLDDFTDH